MWEHKTTHADDVISAFAADRAINHCTVRRKMFQPFL